MRIVLAATVVVLIVFAASCGGSKAKQPTEQERAETAARSALLTLADMPPGWKIQNEEEEEPLEPWEAQFEADFRPRWEACGLDPAFWGDDMHFPGELANVDAPTFESPNDQTVSLAVAYFPTAAEADQAYSTLRTGLTDCDTTMSQYFREMSEVQIAHTPELEGTGYVLSYLPTAPPAVGNETLGFRIESVAPGIDFVFVGEAVIFVQGRFIGMFTFEAHPDDFGPGEAILRHFGERMRSSSELFAS
jgi:hypothetical protein